MGFVLARPKSFSMDMIPGTGYWIPVFKKTSIQVQETSIRFLKFFAAVLTFFGLGFDYFRAVRTFLFIILFQ